MVPVALRSLELQVHTAEWTQQAVEVRIHDLGMLEVELAVALSERGYWQEELG